MHILAILTFNQIFGANERLVDYQRYALAAISRRTHFAVQTTEIYFGLLNGKLRVQIFHHIPRRFNSSKIRAYTSF